jgi:hypothetical protein
LSFFCSLSCSFCCSLPTTEQYVSPPASVTVLLRA